MFSKDPFRRGRLPRDFDVSDVAALRYAQPLIWTNELHELIRGEVEHRKSPDQKDEVVDPCR